MLYVATEARQGLFEIVPTDGHVPLGEQFAFSQYLLDADKGYEAVMRMGMTTTTGDAEGELLAERDVTVGGDDPEHYLPHFLGDLAPVPPMYAAP
ncbi:hypothetical protein ACV35G_30710, partial [Pseudomonas aeruginosa]